MVSRKYSDSFVLASGGSGSVRSSVGSRNTGTRLFDISCSNFVLLRSQKISIDENVGKEEEPASLLVHVVTVCKPCFV